MIAHTPSGAPTSYGSLAKHKCPQCIGNLRQTPRRPIDRITSRFTPLHRYRCESFTCQWEGNFRTREHGFAVDSAGARLPDSPRAGLLSDAPSGYLPKSFIANMVLVVAGVLFVLVFANTGWLSDDESANSGTHDEQWIASLKRIGQARKVEPDVKAHSVIVESSK